MKYFGKNVECTMQVTRIAIILLVVFFAASCDKYTGPDTESIENVAFQEFGNFQVGIAGEYLDSPIGINVNDNIDYQNKGYRTELSVMLGGGMITTGQLLTDANGSAFTSWQLGNSNGKQEIEYDLYNPEDKLIGTSSFFAYALKPGVWSEVDFSPHNDFSAMISDPEAGVTFAISGCNFFKQGESPYTWNYWATEEQSYQYCNGRDVVINSNGTIFRVEWNGNLFRSSDHGESWEQVASPYEGDSSYYLFNTKNNYLWTWKNQIKHSTDGGTTWVSNYDGLNESQELVDVYSLSDGTIFLLTQFNLNYTLYKSTNGGTVWEELENSDWLQRIFVTDDDELIKLTRNTDYSSFNLLKSTDKGVSWNDVFHGAGSTNYRENQIFLKNGDYYYLAIVNGGVFRTREFEDFEKISDLDIRELFADHNGNMVGMGGFYHDKAYYFLKSDH